jgi:serine/threonine protein kinase
MPGILPGPQGEVSLRDLIKLGPLPIDRVVFFAREIARSMCLAGKAVPGLVHGDLKPENVLIIAGAPLLSDFGLARLAGQVLGGDALVGTRTYQSAQARDAAAPLAAVDDVYSFGVMLAEMLTGRSRPKHGWHSQPDRRATTDTTARTRTGLLALARRCRASNPAQRTVDFAAVLAELDRIAPESKWPMPASAKFGTTMGVHSVGEFVMGNLSTTGLLLKLEQYEMVLELISTTDIHTRDWRYWLHKGTALQFLDRNREALEAFCRRDRP